MDTVSVRKPTPRLSMIYTAETMIEGVIYIGPVPGVYHKKNGIVYWISVDGFEVRNEPRPEARFFLKRNRE